MKKILSLFIVLFFCFQITVSAQSMSDMKMFMVEKLTINKDNAPVTNADVYAFNQTRTTDANGTAEFENADEGNATIKVNIDGKGYSQSINITSDNTTVSITGDGISALNTTSQNPISNTNNSNIILYGALILLIIAIAGILLFKKFGQRIKNYSKKNKNTHKVGLALGGITTFVLLAALITQSVFVNDTSKTYNIADNSKAAVLSSISSPTNVRAFGDDRVATIDWNEPVNADSQKIVGYFVQWGLKSQGTLTNSKQTIYTTTQIQPLTDGQEYIVQVQSVQGSYSTGAPKNETGQSSTYAIANGNLSNPVQTSVTPTSARVDAMRSRDTGFFDDFNRGAGELGEDKWNTAYSGCTVQGSQGEFINSQFHAHSQLKSECDRGYTVARPRALFDVTQTTDDKPGMVEFDMDGVTQPRDAWYLDLISSDVKKDANGNPFPIDLTSHDDQGSTTTSDPGNMIRLTQHYDGMFMQYFDDKGVSHELPFTANSCPGWQGLAHNFSSGGCLPSKRTGTFSPIPMSDATMDFIPNVRRHWVFEISHNKIKLFIDNYPIIEANVPSMFSNINQYNVHFTTFTYNTGKQAADVVPTTSIIHWDNFGFSGSAPTTVVHNYLDGGPDGATPYIGTGPKGGNIDASGRKLKINMPDSIGTPITNGVRLMYTLQGGVYTWKSSYQVSVNGHIYKMPEPKTQTIFPFTDNSLVTLYSPFGMSIVINPADLVTGMNSIAFTMDEGDGNYPNQIFNVHLEMNYNKNSAPSFTSPSGIFSNFGSVVTPVMATNDSYWFVEQNMGLTNTISTPIPTTPTATPVATTTPIVSANCLCGTGDICSNSCTFASGNSNAGLSCNSEIGTPTPADKNKYCTREYRTKGDADGDGVINSLDYIYYVRAVNGGTVPGYINADFNGDGKISVTDRNIVIQNIQK